MTELDAAALDALGDARGRGGIVTHPRDWIAGAGAPPVAIGTAVKTSDRVVGTVELYRWRPETASYRYTIKTAAGALVDAPMVIAL